MDLKESEILGEQAADHWYYRSKALALRSMVEPYRPFHRILDVGAGDGFFSKELLRQGVAAEATCVDPGYEREWEETLPGGSVVRFRKAVESSKADLVILMDVLEHVDDDVALLSEYSGLVGPGRLVAITVPAFQLLWSSHDDFLEHRRRYTLRGLEALMRSSGVEVLRSHYFFGGVFPAAAASRLVSRRRNSGAATSSLKVHHPATDRALGAICRAETRVQRLNRVAGLSVFAIGVVRAV